jgi:arylsulfatase
VIPFEGTSLVQLFDGNELPDRPIFFEHEGNRAVRHGKWKLVAKAEQPWELYDLTNDRSELIDLAEQRPQVAEELEQEWNDWADRANVRPYNAWRKSRRK